MSAKGCLGLLHTNCFSPGINRQHSLATVHDDVMKWTHFSALLAICAENSPVTGEFPAQRPVTRSFDVFFYLLQIKRLSKRWWGWWFETPLRPIWGHYYVPTPLTRDTSLLMGACCVLNIWCAFIFFHCCAVCHCMVIWGLVCQKQVSRAETNSYIP